MPTADVTVTITPNVPEALINLEKARDTLALAEILERHLPKGTPSAVWLGAAGELATYVAAQRAEARRS